MLYPLLGSQPISPSGWQLLCFVSKAGVACDLTDTDLVVEKGTRGTFEAEGSYFGGGRGRSSIAEESEQQFVEYTRRIREAEMLFALRFALKDQKHNTAKKKSASLGRDRSLASPLNQARGSSL
jgi:hypothetical protein